jgi:Sec-independent protein translocase protein TatA
MLLAVIVLGPSRLVKTAREAGRLVRDLKAYFHTFSDELKTELDVLDDLKDIRRDLRS